MWGQSNYPPSGGNPYAAGAGGYGGPPPPPGGGYGTGSAYNVNQYPSYGGYGMGNPPPGAYGQPYGGYGTGGSYSQYGGYSQGAAVPGFTAPPAPPQYGGGQYPPHMSSQYGMMQHHMTNQYHINMQADLARKMGLIDMTEEDKEELEMWKRKQRQARRRLLDDGEGEDVDYEAERTKMEERARRAEEKTRELQERLESDDSLKLELRSRFIDELMRRQEVSGTFENTMGTVTPFEEYDEEDPVAKWFSECKGDSIVGEKWDALFDCEYLRDGIRGWGTDEAAIIAVVSTRCNSQRNKMLKDYKTSYGRDLIHDLKGDLSGSFRLCVLGLFETPARYDAYSIKKAIYGAGTDEQCLIEILMTRTNAQLQEMAQEYNYITYKKQAREVSSIEQDLEEDISSFFKKLSIAAVQGNRRLIEREKLEEAVVETIYNGKWTGMFHIDYSKLCNMRRCARMAEELFNCGEEKWGTDEETFVRIFSTQDYYTMRMVWDEYVKISQRDIMNSVERETSGDFRRGLLAIAQNIKCRPMYFAERLYKSMKGAGTNDATLIRVVVSRSEIDMVQIKQCFLEKYKQTLWNFIKHDTSGDYRTLLCGIVGKN